MFTPETTAFLEGGCALTVASVGVDGMPTAGRAWGLTVLSRDLGEARLVLDASSEQIRIDLATTRVIAVTGADVATLRSIQMKGTVVELQAATGDDDARADQYSDAFFDDIHRVDGTERALLERVRPTEFVACIVRFTDFFDQSPGPTAGGVLSPSDA